MILKLLPFVGLIVFANAIKRYDNYKVYNVIPKSEVEVQMLTDLKKQGFDFWTDVLVVGKDARVMISPAEDEEFVAYTKNVGLDAIVTIPNVQELINAQLKPAQNGDRSSRLGSFSWDRYHTLEEIHAWLDELVTLYPDVVSTVVLGTSYEGRELKAVVIDFNRGNRGDNPLTAMIEGGIHAREWISPATVTWIIKEFLTSEDPEVRFLAETFVWHILPVTNPDGYAYTFSNTRMWRKNRNPANYVNCTSGTDRGNGIDLNRNFDFVWMTTGASANPCDETYAGPIASSEAEALAISNYVLRLKQTGNVIYYFAFHSFSQMMLIPYSHVSGLDVLQVPNYADMYEIAIHGAEKLSERYGTRYEVGTSADILYEVSGSSFDWVKGVAEVPIVYLFELRDTGVYGFLLPPEQIIPNNEEIIDCLVEMDKMTRQLGYYSGAMSSYASGLVLATSLLFVLFM